jgi:hypothetical protein
LHRGPLAVAVPEAPPSARWSLGGSRVAYKAAAAPCRDAQVHPSHRRAVCRRRAGLPRQARVSPAALPSCGVLHLLKPSRNRSPPHVAFPGRRLTGTGSHGGHHRRPPVCRPSRQPLSPTEPPNQTPVDPRPLPYPPRSDSGEPSPEFHRIAAGRHPRDPIAGLPIFPGAQPQSKGMPVRI